MKIKALVAGVVLAGVGAQAMAATDGTYGATSQGQAIITATVGNMVRVSAVQDVTLTAAGGWVGTGNACVFNNVGGAYNVTLSTANPSLPGEFNLTGPGGAQLYTVNWNGVASASGTAQAAAGATQVADCGAPGNTNASYTISAAGSIGTVLPVNGVYTDTLTILVAP